MQGVEERLDAETIARGEEGAVDFVPEDESELAAQAMEACGAEVFVEMQRDLAVGAGAQAVACALRVPAGWLVTVELAVDDDVRAFVLAGDRLVAGGEIDDAEPRVTESNAAVWADPVALPIGTAMIEAARGAFKRRHRDRVPARKKCDNSAHSGCLLVQWPWGVARRVSRLAERRFARHGRMTSSGLLPPLIP